MSADEWDEVEYLMLNAFDDFDKDRSAAYFTFLQRFSKDEVVASLHRLVQSGQKWRPKLGELADAIQANRAPALPSWATVYFALYEAPATRVTRLTEYGSRKATEKQVIEALYEQVHPWVAEWVTVQTVKRLCLLPVDDPEYGQLERKRLMENWDAFVKERRDDNVTDRTLEALTGRVDRRALGLRKPSLLEAAGLVPPRELGPGELESPPDRP